jgi:hypothetical protein
MSKYISEEVRKDAVFKMTLRHKYRNKKLKPEQISAVEQAIKGWEWNPRQDNKSVSDYVAIAEVLAKANEGILPPLRDIKKLDPNLSACLSRLPEMFSHIPRKKLLLTIEEHLVIAKKLAVENGGILPSRTTMRKKGYASTEDAMRKRPELFAEIAPDSMFKTVEYWIDIAESLARTNNGILPKITEIDKDKNRGIGSAIRSHRDRFAHIPRDYGRKTDSEWVNIAEGIAADHGGTLPSPPDLHKLNHKNVVASMQRRPDLYTHISKSLPSKKTVEDWVCIAEKLVKKEGFTPCHADLKKRKLLGLAACIYKYPKSFSHLNQKLLVERKTSAEWKQLAVEIASNNNGVLPSYIALEKMGYGSINSKMYTNPSIFKGIKRENSFISAADHMLSAQTLAANNGGSLPSKKWMLEHEFSKLASHISENAELYFMFERDKAPRPGRKRGSKNGKGRNPNEPNNRSN